MWKTGIALVACIVCSAVAAPQAGQPSGSSSAASSATSQAATPSQSSILPPFYSAPNSFTPTATGSSAIPGSTVTLINTAGAGSVSDTFVYTAAASTVPPTGNVTLPVTGAGVTESNLEASHWVVTLAMQSTDLPLEQPNPANLQTAAASPRPLASLQVAMATTIFGVLLVGAIGGAAMV
ncbi:hypothetical protein OIV83_005783 [Microbotryomycetes sp. JL201]|nr:hypothetical protein OIV83_005783 [Microbotryomycetes sp. JL201]